MEQSTTADPLVILIDLEKRARNVLTVKELHFVFVNETHNLLPYLQAILFSSDGTPLALSGISTIEKGTPFYLWLKREISPIIRNCDQTRINLPSDKIDEKYSEWDTWFPESGILQPLRSPNGDYIGALLLLKNSRWSEEEQHILEILADTYGHAWNALAKPKKYASWKKIKTKYKIAGLIICLLLMAIPVRLSVLAPVEIVATNPATIRAPVDGVVEVITVKPNQSIKVGEQIVVIDASAQQNELAVAAKILSSLNTEYAQISRLAISDPKSKRRLSKTAGQIKEQETRIQYLRSLITRMTITAPIRGTAIVDNPTGWEGKPVNIGERIMSIADPKTVEAEVWLSISNAIDLPVGSPIRIYLNTDPLSPVDGVVTSFSYKAQISPSGTLAHRIRGKLDLKFKPPRLGLRGTARLEGQKVSFAYWILRRPISVIRQFLGV